jgi:hypothetical protein
MKQGKILLVAAALTALFCLAMNAAAYADDCPAGGGTCKIVTITQSEMQSLTGPGMIFDSAAWANRANLQGVVDAWKAKIAASPDGTVKPAPEAAKKQDKLPEGKK